MHRPERRRRKGADVGSYESFARFYDAVNEEPVETITGLLRDISTYSPGATRILELGCGTGAVLAGLGSGFELTGIDLSDEMLSYARRRCPQATLVHDDISSFDLGESFDVVICVYDTLNHVTTFAGWEAVFDRVSAHLIEGGLFVFDINSLGRLRELAEMAPWVHDFDGNTLIMKVDIEEGDLATWDIRVFEKRPDRSFALHHEQIVELGVDLERVRFALESRFEILELRDSDGSSPPKAASRVVGVCRRVG